MDEPKLVKVDNWGIYFLQKLKHFFNRTDYCDLTLQFQDNAQLKVHRLVLSACTEYFELLEKTCEMYEDCLVMPDDLQADIVVPIVNFMYTGQLEFRMELLDKLHQCSEILNMPILTKLLDSHRTKPIITQSYNAVKRTHKVMEGTEKIKSISASEIVTTVPVTYKRSSTKAFEKTTVYRDKKVYLPINKPSVVNNGVRSYREPSPIPLDKRFNKKVVSGDPRPTRYELPEELDTDNIFENSFCSISYTSQPLMVHPETRKQYSKRPRLASEASTSKRFTSNTVDIVENKQPIRVLEESLFEDSIPDESEAFADQFISIKAESPKDSNKLFDQMLEKNESKLSIETKNIRTSASLDHAKIISEVLKKYPHLVKSNKNIKLKILNSPSKNTKKHKLSPVQSGEKPLKSERDSSDYTYETDVLDSKQAAKLIALGAENTDGPWICLICGAPGKAMNFTSYHKFRRHLVDVHNEKPVLNICEYCGQRSSKRNYILHHMYTKHGVQPPSHYNFPKCNHCNYVALSEALLVKHKASHADSKNFRCNVCHASFYSSNQLLMHIQNTGHKYSSDRKANHQCIYCLKVFMRESNLCSHLKSHHRKDAIKDGIVDDSDDEDSRNIVKSEPTINDFEDLDMQYQLHQRPDGKITLVQKKVSEHPTTSKQKILNASLSTQALTTPTNKVVKPSLRAQDDYVEEINMSSNDTHEDIVMIDNNEYVMRNNQLIPRRPKQVSEEFIMSSDGIQSIISPTTMEFTDVQSSNDHENIQHANMLLKHPIYVSNEEYKALLASNQSIVIDTSDSNKTLTVLTASHASGLETNAIDLNATQSNDMMIIQDEYPLNVSETGTSENSNVVVVYSHEVGDQSKQRYQILTTQGAQFVQSSAIITQNFQTVNTTTPVMNTHVSEKPVENVWHGSIEQIVNSDQIEITPVTLQSVTEQTDQVQETYTTESNSDMCDLPQVELPSNVTESTDTSVAPVSNCQDMVPVEVPSNAEKSVDSSQIISSMEVDNVGLIEHIVEETVDSVNAIDTSIENMTVPDEEVIMKSVSDIEETELIESQTYTQPEPTVAEIINEVPLQTKEMCIDNQTTVIENIQISNEEEPVPNPSNISDVSINAEQTLTRDVSETVQSLTSEWSEEEKSQDIQEDDVQVSQEKEMQVSQEEDMQVSQSEDMQVTQSEDMQVGQSEDMQVSQSEDMQDKQNENPDETIPLDDGVMNKNQQYNKESSEVEESIENIQQEVYKQMSATSPAKEKKPVPIATDPADKISCLLTEWEDNDSQEDEPTENIKDDPIESSVSETTTEKEDPANQKIKRLVSDWDDDEEEIKD